MSDTILKSGCSLSYNPKLSAIKLPLTPGIILPIPIKNPLNNKIILFIQSPLNFIHVIY